MFTVAERIDDDLDVPFWNLLLGCQKNERVEAMAWQLLYRKGNPNCRETRVVEMPESEMDSMYADGNLTICLPE